MHPPLLFQAHLRAEALARLQKLCSTAPPRVLIGLRLYEHIIGGETVAQSSGSPANGTKLRGRLDYITLQLDTARSPAFLNHPDISSRASSNFGEHCHCRAIESPAELTARFATRLSH